MCCHSHFLLLTSHPSSWLLARPPSPITIGSAFLLRTLTPSSPHREASDGTGSETDGLSIAEELTASALRIPGSQRRSLVPRWQRRRRLSSGSSHVSSVSRGPSPASSGVSSSRVSSGKAGSRRAGSSRAGSVGRGGDSGAESGNESGTSGGKSVASFVTPARPLPTVNQGAAFQQGWAHSRRVVFRMVSSGKARSVPAAFVLCACYRLRWRLGDVSAV